MHFPEPAEIVLVSLLDLIVVLHVGRLAYTFWKPGLEKSLRLTQGLRLAIWFLTCGDTFTLTAFTAKGVETGQWY
jgi:hypothetical protein